MGNHIHGLGVQGWGDGSVGWGWVVVDGVHSYGPRPLKPTGGDMAIS